MKYRIAVKDKELFKNYALRIFLQQKWFKEMIKAVNFTKQ